ncbi:hypothetical protein V8E36_009627 [Tilletia maclaganii]
MTLATPTPALAIRADIAAPTRPPVPAGQPVHVLLTPAEIEQRRRRRHPSPSFSDKQQQQQQQQRRSGRREEIVVGPLWARSEEDVHRAKREWDAEQARKRRARPAASIGSRGEGKALAAAAASHGNDLVKKTNHLTQAEQGEERALGPVLSDDEWAQMRRAAEYQSELDRRQNAEQERCYVGNAELSCFPTADLAVPQGTYSKFIWNSYFPLFIQQGFVDVYLYREDQDRIQTSWTSQVNEAGRISFSPSDSWWQDRPRAQNIQPGQNISWPFYFVVNPSGLDTGGTTLRQSTWFAVQTALPAAIASSRSASAAASASAASVTDAAISASISSELSAQLQSSLNAQGMTGTQTLVGTVTSVLPDGQTVIITATGRANGTLSGGDGGNSAGSNADDGGGGLPRWAIAVIVILGVLAIVFVAIAAYVMMRKARRRSDSAAAAAGADGRSSGVRESTGSTSPMMRNIGGPGATHSLDEGLGSAHSAHNFSPSGGHGSSIGYASAAGVGAGAGILGSAAQLPTARSVRSSGDSHLFSSEEATRMADAFRNALRKPEFTAGGAYPGGAELPSPREDDGDGESPGVDTGSPLAGAMGEVGRESRSDSAPAKVAPALLKQELASEGKDLRQVGDRKKAQYHEDAAAAAAAAAGAGASAAADA